MRKRQKKLKQHAEFPDGSHAHENAISDQSDKAVKGRDPEIRTVQYTPGPRVRPHFFAFLEYPLLVCYNFP